MTNSNCITNVVEDSNRTERRSAMSSSILVPVLTVGDEYHPLCLLFPQADDQTNSDLTDDIKANGQRDPIVLYRGQILDGRNRYLACKEAGINPQYEHFEGNDTGALRYVISKNMYRRHLNESQRAQLAQKILKLSRASDTPLTQKQAAKQMNVSERSLNRAAKIDEFASDEAKAIIDEKKITVSKAADALKEAEEKTGIKVTKDTPEADRKEVQRVHEQILNDEEPESTERPAGSKSANEFNDKVRDGEYNGKKFRRSIRKIQAIITPMGQLPELFNDSIENSKSVEDETNLNALFDTILELAKQIESLRTNWADESFRDTESAKVE